MKLLDRLSLKIHKAKNIDFSIKLFIIGMAAIISFTALSIYINYSMSIFNDNVDFISILIALIVGMVSFLIGIVSLYRTKEMTIYSMVYEKRKNSSIRLYYIVLININIFSGKERLKVLNYLLKKGTEDYDVLQFLLKFNESKMIKCSRKLIYFILKKLFLKKYIY